jgi:hypothetical protein
MAILMKFKVYNRREHLYLCHHRFILMLGIICRLFFLEFPRVNPLIQKAIQNICRGFRRPVRIHRRKKYVGTYEEAVLTLHLTSSGVIAGSGGACDASHHL